MKGQVTSKVTRLKIPPPGQRVNNCSIFMLKTAVALEQGSLRNLFFRPELFNAISHLPEIPLRGVRRNTCLGVHFGQCLL